LKLGVLVECVALQVGLFWYICTL